MCCLIGFSETGLPSQSNGGVFMREKICGIYKITSPAKRVYIGQSIDCAKRKTAYKNRKGGSQPRLERSIKKYGWERHTFEVIHQCDRCDLNKLEAYYISLYNSYQTEYGMNLQSGGGNYEVSDETKAKIRAKALGRKASEETKRKISEAGKGRITSPETKAKISAYHKGRIRSEAHSKALSISKKGKGLSDQTKMRMSEYHKSKPLEKTLNMLYARHPHLKNDSARQAEIKAKMETVLTKEQIEEIKQKYKPYKYTLEMLRKEYGVSQAKIYTIISSQI